MINHQSALLSCTNTLISLGCTSSDQSIEIMEDTCLLNMVSNKSYDQYLYSLRKHTHANCLVVKMKIFTGKKCDIFLIFAQNIDCGYTLDWLRLF